MQEQLSVSKICLNGHGKGTQELHTPSGKESRLVIGSVRSEGSSSGPRAEYGPWFPVTEAIEGVGVGARGGVHTSTSIPDVIAGLTAAREMVFISNFSNSNPPPYSINQPVDYHTCDPHFYITSNAGWISSPSHDPLLIGGQ